MGVSPTAAPVTLSMASRWPLAAWPGPVQSHPAPPPAPTATGTSYVLPGTGCWTPSLPQPGLQELRSLGDCGDWGGKDAPRGPRTWGRPCLDPAFRGSPVHPSFLGGDSQTSSVQSPPRCLLPSRGCAHWQARRPLVAGGGSLRHKPPRFLDPTQPGQASWQSSRPAQAPPPPGSLPPSTSTMVDPSPSRWLTGSEPSFTSLTQHKRPFVIRPPPGTRAHFSRSSS